MVTSLMMLVFALPLAGGSLAAPAPAGSSLDQEREALVLRGGARIEGRVIKATADKLFVDIGYTVLEVPIKEILSRKVLTADGVEKPAVADPDADYLMGSGGRERPIQELSASLGSSVVMVNCPSKTGSGFFVNRKGYVVTNCHVVEGERKITLTVFEKRAGGGFERKKVRDVRIVALNPYYDLAVLQVGEKELSTIRFTPAPLGNEDDLEAGEGVFAIGNPQGLERSVTEGIISTTARAFEGLLYLQTTTQINPGNSGGPLFNLRGEVIGVTNMKRGMGSEGLGFAIPCRRVREVLDNVEAFAFDADNPNTGHRYLAPPPVPEPEK
jgi:serine protease Do